MAETNNSRNIIVSVIILIVMVIVGWFVLTRDVPENVLDAGNEGVTTPPERITIEGQYECLPHRDTSGPQTLECATGLLGEDGKHYALSFMALETGIPTDLAIGSRIRIEGPILPAAALNQDITERYVFDGLITVTTLERLEPVLP